MYINILSMWIYIKLMKYVGIYGYFKLEIIIL